MTTKMQEKSQNHATPAQRTLELGLKLNNLYEVGLQIKSNARTDLTQQDIEKKLQAHIKKNGLIHLKKSKPAPQQEHLQIQTKTTSKGQPQYKLTGVEKVILAALTCLQLAGIPDIKVTAKGEMTVTITAEIGQAQTQKPKAKTKTGVTVKPIKVPLPAPIPMKQIAVKATVKRSARKTAAKKGAKRKSPGGAAA